MLESLKESLENCPIIDKDGYKYFVHPITDGIPQMDPHILREVVQEIKKINEANEYDYIIGAEAMAIPLGVALSLTTDKPFVVIRKRKYDLPGEVEVEQTTGYSKNKLFINGVKKGDRVIIVDDVVSTGGTLRALVKTLDAMGVIIMNIIIVIEKGPAKSQLEKEIGHTIDSLVKVEANPDGSLKVID